jgi:hypothetical protein
MDIWWTILDAFYIHSLCENVFLFIGKQMRLHRLEKAATMDVSDRIWKDQTPNCISDIVLMEQLTLSHDY